MHHAISLVAIGAIAGCTNSSSNAAFTPAQVTVDSSATMNALTTDQQTTLCAQLSQSLTASFGSPDTICLFNAKSGSTCDSDYNTCVAQAPAVTSVSACTGNNDDMFACTITVAQFTACFNATNEVLLRTLTGAAVCAEGEPAQPTADEMAACAAAQCDYVWFD